MENDGKKWPLYITVKNRIKEKIQNGEYRQGDPLPTEKSLCDAFGVSRVTVRKAISELVDEEVLNRSYGKTAVVQKNSVHRNINRLSGLYEELKEDGVLCSSYVLSNTVMEADGELAEKMGLRPGDKVVNLSRIRYANEKPLCYQRAFLNYTLCAGLENMNLSSRSLYEVLETVFGLQLSYATQTISACTSSYKIAALLESSESPILRIDRTAYLESDVCVEHSNSYYLGNNYCLHMKLKR